MVGFGFWVPDHLPQLSAKFEGELVAGSLGGHVYAFSEMMDYVASLSEP